MLVPVEEARSEDTWDNTNEVVLQGFRMLFAGDGDGINYMLGITGKEEGTMFTRMMFRDVQSLQQGLQPAAEELRKLRKGDDLAEQATSCSLLPIMF